MEEENKKEVNLQYGSTKLMLYAGQIVCLRTRHEWLQGINLKVIEVFDDLIKVEANENIYYFYESELEISEPCV